MPNEFLNTRSEACISVLVNVSILMVKSVHGWTKSEARSDGKDQSWKSRGL